MTNEKIARINELARKSIKIFLMKTGNLALDISSVMLDNGIYNQEKTCIGRRE